MAGAVVEASGAAPDTTAPRTTEVTAKRVALAFAFAIVACILGYLALAVPGRWLSPLPDKVFTARDLSVSRGTGSVEGDELVITRPGENNDTVIAVGSDLRSSDYSVISWIAIDVPDDAQVALLWQSDFEPGRINRAPVTVVSGRLLPVVVSKHPRWLGRITGVALVIRSPILQPIRMRGVIAKPADAPETMLDRMREWIAFERWTGSSINLVTGGADVQDLPLPLLLITAMVIATVLLLWMARRHLRALAPRLAVAIAGLFLLSWFVLDARWSFNLARQAHVTSMRYAGKDWHEKHMAAEDAALFAFIEKARALMPKTPTRVFVVADAHYLRGRTAYHLYPHNVWFEPYRNAVPPADQLRPGDWIVVVQRRGVQYDPQQERLRWDGGATVPVQLKLAEAGDALFVVK